MECSPVGTEEVSVRGAKGERERQYDYRLCHTTDLPGGQLFVFVSTLRGSRNERRV